MEHEVAMHAVRVADRAGTLLTELLDVIHENCPEQEYQKFRANIAEAIYEIHDKVSNLVYELSPSTKEEVGKIVDQYKRLI